MIMIQILILVLKQVGSIIKTKANFLFEILQKEKFAFVLYRKIELKVKRFAKN